MKIHILTLAVVAGVVCSALGGHECLPAAERVDCYPEPFASETKCKERGCNWCQEDGSKAPACHVPKGYGYKVTSETPKPGNKGLIVELERKKDQGTYYGKDFEKLQVDVTFESNYRLRVKIAPTTGPKRWEVPLEVQKPANEGTPENRLYSVEVVKDPFAIKVIRRPGEGEQPVTIFDTSLGGFTFADQFIQFATKLPSNKLYGIGENEQHSFKHKFENYPNYPIWGRDQPPDANSNMYGAQPYYTVLENSGKAHSVAIVNSNAQDFTLMPPQSLVYRTIGGILDMYIFLGPTPENVVQQYTEAVGRASIPPYWALGFQLSRYGYNYIKTMKDTIDRNVAKQIPVDVLYGDIDIMERELDFTYDKERFKGLPEYVKEIKGQGIKFITILDPCISIGEKPGTYPPFDIGNKADIWITKSNGSAVIGKVWPADPVYFPDYSKQTTKDWWINEIVKFKNVLDFDSLWIDMNEPANFVAGDLYEGCKVNKWNNPPYVPRIVANYLPDKTVCPDHRDGLGLHYDTHNIYGWLESEPTLRGMEKALSKDPRNPKRGFILSRSTFLGSGKWAAHWLGDNWSKWTNLHYSIIGMLQYNQWGIPFVGADICGFINDSTEDMCERWMQLGAFYPFSRNHNGLGYKEQDPAAWGDVVVESSKKALNIRYTLLPYLYTLFYEHTTFGSTVVRALWHQYPQDPVSATIDTQFLWGSGLMISPALKEGQTSVNVYFPNERAYEYITGTESTKQGGFEGIPTPKGSINLHVLGGNILPTQEPAVNTELSKKNPLGLIVALDKNLRGKGSLYYDSGDSADPTKSFYLAKYEARPMTEATKVCQLTGRVESETFSLAHLELKTIRVLGLPSTVKKVTLKVGDGTPTEHPIKLVGSSEIRLENLKIPPHQPFEIEFLEQGTTSTFSRLPENKFFYFN